MHHDTKSFHEYSEKQLYIIYNFEWSILVELFTSAH